MINKTITIRFDPAMLRVLATLQAKTGLSRRNSVIRYAIARLAEREGVSMITGRPVQRKATAR